MTTRQEYEVVCRSLVADVGDCLTSNESGEVLHLIDHGEPPEGLRTLAWIIVEEDKRVPASAIARMRDLMTGLVDPDHLPPDLDSHGIPGR